MDSVKFFICFCLIFLTGCVATQELSFKNSIDNLFVTVERHSEHSLKIETVQCQHTEIKFHATCMVRAYLSDGTPFQLQAQCSTRPNALCNITALAPVGGPSGSSPGSQSIEL